MKIKIYAKLCALPISIVATGFGFYYFIFDSFNQYRQQHVITIKQAESQEKEEDIENERTKMREELDKIRQSANADFIHNAISISLNRISSYANIEFRDTKTSQVKPKQEESVEPPKSETVSNKKDIIDIDYVPYRQIHTHELPDVINNNNMGATPLETKNVKAANTKWAIPKTKEVKIYYSPDTQSKVLAINKNGVKMQVVATKSSWVKVRFATKRESFKEFFIIEGYIPMRDIILL